MPRSTTHPGPHPEPPADLASRELPITEIGTGEVWFRLHRAEHAPVYFGRSGRSRFDAPNAEFGVLYLGDSPHCCFIETYGRVAGSEARIVTRSDLSVRRLAVVAFHRALRVVDLTASGLAKLGADNRLCTGDYGVAGRWTLALWSHPNAPDGLLYRSRHDPSRMCLALFDRAADAVIVTSDTDLLDSSLEPTLAEALDSYGIGFIEA